jgi:hypothetical protein
VLGGTEREGGDGQIHPKDTGLARRLYPPQKRKKKRKKKASATPHRKKKLLFLWEWGDEKKKKNGITRGGTPMDVHFKEGGKREIVLGRGKGPDGSRGSTPLLGKILAPIRLCFFLFFFFPRPRKPNTQKKAQLFFAVSFAGFFPKRKKKKKIPRRRT